MISDRRLLVVISVLVVVIFMVLFFGIRSCAPAGSGNTVIYSNLDLADAAKVVARLKELKIPYELREKGTAVAVPKDQAAPARLGLAEKNLPAGGVVGWEIFNETKMGATDFDRRIQLIRAISGELSRTIRRIEGVSDARVQIVLPETRLFEIAKAPVTASVLLRLNPGTRLRDEQIRGIIHLVASSVENLQTENVTVVDDSGRILSATAQPSTPKLLPETAEATTLAATPLAAAAVKGLTNLEKELLRIEAKEEYERQLSESCQNLLSNFFQADAVIAKVKVEFGDDGSTRLKISSSSGEVFARIKKITVIVMVDEKLTLSPKMKKNIYSTMALAVPYDRLRGDQINIKTAPLQKTKLPEIEKNLEPVSAKEKPGINFISWLGIAAVALIIVFLAVRLRKKKEAVIPKEEIESQQSASAEEAGDAVRQIKDLADQDPERIANLLKQWLTEENNR